MKLEGTISTCHNLKNGVEFAVSCIIDNLYSVWKQKELFNKRMKLFELFISIREMSMLACLCLYIMLPS